MNAINSKPLNITIKKYPESDLIPKLCIGFLVIFFGTIFVSRISNFTTLPTQSNISHQQQASKILQKKDVKVDKSEIILAQNNGGGGEAIPGFCSKLGINTAVPFSNGSVSSQYGRGGTKWVLSIAFTPGEINMGEICANAGNGVKTIIRPWCVGQNCEMFNSQLQGLADVLNQASCEVYVTGPNEALTELADASDIAQASATMVNNLISRVSNPNVKILTPVFNATDPNNPAYTQSIKTKLNWGGIYGIAVNSYSLPGGNSASGYVNDFLNQLGIAKPVIVTETGMIEQNSGVGRDQAVQNMQAELAAMAGRGDVEAILFFNGSGLNPQSDFTYGCINGSELETLSGGSCSDDGLNCGNIEEDYQSILYSNESGCCENLTQHAIQSCTVNQVSNNGGNTTSFDAINAGIQMKELPDGTWIYKYAVTEHIHNFPLLKFLSSAFGTDQHPFTTDAQDDNVLNMQNYQLSFTNQFPGIAQFNLGNGSNFQLQVPSLGTATGAALFNRRNFYEDDKPHCGLYYRSDDVDEDNIEPNDLLDLIKKWIDDTQTTITKFDEATKTNYLQELVDFIKNLLGLKAKDSCAEMCSDSGAPIKVCNNSDAYTFSRDAFEVIIDGNIIRGQELPYMTPLTPSQVCDLMFLSNDAQGGSCTMSNGSDTITLEDPVARSFDLTGNPGLKLFLISVGAVTGDATNADEATVYKAFTGAGYQGTKINGNPFFKVTYGATNKLQLEGLLKMLEETYRTERVYNPRGFQGYKICHKDNIGIKVTSTKRLYDYFLTDAPAGSDNAPGITSGLDNSESPPDQIFYAVDADGIGKPKPVSRYGMCDPETYYFDKLERAKAKLANTSGGGGQSNSQATVEHIYPWIGQIPLMWERIAVWGVNNEFDFTDSTPTLEEILEIIAKIKAVNAEFSNVYLFPCGFFDPYINNVTTDPNYSLIKNIVDQGLKGILGYSDGDIEALANGDCLCGQNETDPLENYLVANGKLETEVVKSGIGRDTDGDGIPDFCEAYANVSDGDVSTPFSHEGLISPLDRVDRVSQAFGDGAQVDYCSTVGDPNAVEIIRNNGMCRFHTGIDLTGSPEIKAAADGRIIKVQNDDGGYGQYVKIFHEHLGVTTLYGHMVPGSVRVQIGQEVQEGDVIGIMGTSGNSSGVHLHFEIRACDTYKKNCFIDPTPIFSGSVTNPDPEDPGDGNIPKACEAFLREVPVPEEGSFDNYICLMKKVVNATNTKLSGSADKGIPWELLWATMYNETKTRCTPSHVAWRKTNNPTWYTRTDPDGTTWQGAQNPDPIGQTPINGYPIYTYTDECTGNPNQLAFYIEPNEVDNVGRGVGQFIPATFDALMTGNYWYNRAKNTDTSSVIQECIKSLGVDISNPVARERDFDTIGSPENSFNQYRPNEFSRIRVADSLCAAAVMLAENSMGAVNSSQEDYKSLQDWAPGAQGEELARRAAEGYYGTCSTGYCDVQFDRYLFALQEFSEPEYDCTGRSVDFEDDEDDNDSGSDSGSSDGGSDGGSVQGEYACPYDQNVNYYIRQETDGPSHSLCEYRKFYSENLGGYYQAVDANIQGVQRVIVRAPANGTLKIVAPWDNPYRECNGSGTKYDGGWAFEVTTGDGKTFRLLHLMPDPAFPVTSGQQVTAGQQIGVLFDGIVREDPSYNSTGRGCFSRERMHVHLTIIGSGDPSGFIRQYCHAPERIDQHSGWTTAPNTCCIKANQCNCSIQNSDPNTGFCAPP